MSDRICHSSVLRWAKWASIRRKRLGFALETVRYVISKLSKASDQWSKSEYFSIIPTWFKPGLSYLHTVFLWLNKFPLHDSLVPEFLPARSELFTHSLSTSRIFKWLPTIFSCFYQSAWKDFLFQSLKFGPETLGNKLSPVGAPLRLDRIYLGFRTQGLWVSLFMMVAFLFHSLTSSFRSPDVNFGSSRS